MKMKTLLCHIISITLLTSTASALACKGTQVIFQDSFKTLDQAWGAVGDNINVSNNTLVIKPGMNKSWAAINQNNLFQNIDYCVTVKFPQQMTDLSTGGGLVFWATDYGDYYFLYVSPDGNFNVTHYTNNRYLDPVPNQPNAAIKKGLGAVNELEVITNGGQATVYINGTQVGSLTGTVPAGGGLIGVRADSEATAVDTWTFSDLKVNKPPQ